MHKILILINTYDVIKAVRKWFDEKCEKIRHKKLMHRMASKLQTNYQKLMSYKGKTPKARQRHFIRDQLTISMNITREQTKEKCSSMIYRFLIAKNAR